MPSSSSGRMWLGFSSSVVSMVVLVLWAWDSGRDDGSVACYGGSVLGCMGTMSSSLESRGKVAQEELKILGEDQI